MYNTITRSNQSQTLYEANGQNRLPMRGVRPLTAGGTASVSLTPQRPQLDGFVATARNKAVLVVEHVQRLNAVGVSRKCLQLDLLEVESGIFIGPSYLVLPVCQPVAT